jgi:hypothetical protein
VEKLIEVAQVILEVVERIALGPVIGMGVEVAEEFAVGFFSVGERGFHDGRLVDLGLAGEYDSGRRPWSDATDGGWKAGG